MEIAIAKDLSAIATEARSKANYMRLRGPDSDSWNYEQKQDASQVLEEFAHKLDNLIVKYFIAAPLVLDKLKMKELEDSVSRQVRTAIRKEREYAEIRRQA
jgi:hypothetical protein